MKYFIDTHDRTKNSYPAGEVSQEQFVAIYSDMDEALLSEGGFVTGAHVNLTEGKAFCLTAAADEAAVAAAHDKIEFPYDSITQVRRVTGMDLR
jgi:Nickel responsive protein SCO4226-like